MLEKMDALVEEFGEAVLDTKDTASKKREADMDPPSGSPKKLRPAGLEASKWEGQELGVVPMINIKGNKAVLDLRAGGSDGGPKVGLVNKCEKSDVMVPKGHIICGFGKGKFKLAEELEKEGEAACKAAILYEIEDLNAPMILNNKLLGLRAIYEEKQKTQANPTINYFKIESTPAVEDAGLFTLSKEHNLAFVPQATTPGLGEEGTTLAQTAAAGAVQASAWDRAVCGVVWACKWAPNGLMPVRPIVVALDDLCVPPGRVLPLTR